MALPICIELPEVPDALSITLPGGVEIEDLDLLKAIQPALTPLVPLFNVVDAIVAVFNCIKGVVDALSSFPPDPSGLLQCVPELAEKVSKLLKLIPQLSLPLTIIGIIDLVIDTLLKVRRQLVHLQRQMERVLETIDRGTNLGDAGLLAIGACAQANVAQEAANVGKMLASLGKLIGLLNLFMGLVGGPKVPDLSNLAGQPLDQAIEPIDAIVEVLQNARAAVPVP